jgi:enoyl-CoA hydratase
LLQLEFNRPDRANALSETAVEELLEAFAPANTAGVQLAVFSGAGANFCAGFDLKQLDETSDAQLLWRMVRLELLLQQIYHSPFMTLALAHGNALGAGADLFCACSMRVADADTTFRMPGWRFGVALGTRRLMHRVGADSAREVLTTSKSFDSKHGLRIGFVHEIVSRADWHEVRTRAERSSAALARDSVERLLSLTAADTRDADLSALVRSACQPGLRDRIQAYVAGSALLAKR